MNSEDESARLRYTDATHIKAAGKNTHLLRRPAPESLKIDLNIPFAGSENEEESDSDLDTDRFVSVVKEKDNMKQTLNNEIV